MKVSIITAVYNRAATIASAIESVAVQDYPDIEYIVINADSDDGTNEIIDSSDRVDKHVCEKDDGIYDALNIGISHATGDVVGFLHADDLLSGPKVISKLMAAFRSNPDTKCTYGDLLYVDFDDPDKIVRYWKSGAYSRENFRRGWMPPHPTVYFHRDAYRRFGNFRLDMNIAADYELMLRMLYRYEIPTTYVPEIFVKMRVGGKSNASLKNRLLANSEDKKAWQMNELRPPLLLQFMKPLRKLPQYWRRPKKLQS